MEQSSFYADGGSGSYYAPDGLTESAIDCLMAEVFAEVAAAPMSLARLSEDEIECRRERRAAMRRSRSTWGQR